MKNNDKKIREIIKYNSARNYFGTWTPKSLHAVYRDIRENPLNYEVSFSASGLLEMDICDVLWNEMSLNPVRFGATSPFEFDGQPNIKMFCQQYRNAQETILSNISTNLDSFVSFMKQGAVTNGYVIIRCDANTGKTNSGYRMLAKLVRIIHDICIQNLADYNKSKKYRTEITKIATKRYPKLVRPDFRVNFSKIDREKPEYEQIQQEIIQKNSEINDISMRIKNLSEYDPPADTSAEKLLLSQKYQELQQLDELLYSQNQIERQ